MGWYRLAGPDGLPAFHELPEGAALPEGAVAVDRAPGAFEDFTDGAWTTDHRGKANWTCGAAHIAEARALKFLEAQLIVLGTSLPDGLLAREATARGTTALALAEEVIARRTGFIEAEVRRQQMQAGQAPDFEI